MITMGHARAIINIENKGDQFDLYKTIIVKDLSDRTKGGLVT